VKCRELQWVWLELQNSGAQNLWETFREYILFMKNTVFWVVTLCSSETAQHFRGTHCFHPQGHTASQARNQCKQAQLVPASVGFLLGLLFDPEALGFLRTTQQYNPEDHTLHNHCYKNLKSNIFYPVRFLDTVWENKWSWTERGQTGYYSTKQNSTWK
jgi:hypothetical protein